MLKGQRGKSKSYIGERHVTTMEKVPKNAGAEKGTNYPGENGPYFQGGKGPKFQRGKSPKYQTRRLHCQRGTLLQWRKKSPYMQHFIITHICCINAIIYVAPEGE